jgi:DNA-binding transcriptional regulator GbsR (MarR family)
VSHGQKNQIKADVEDVLPLNSSGVVAIFEERWEEEIDSALSNAKKVTKEKVDRDSAEQVKAAAGEV